MRARSVLAVVGLVTTVVGLASSRLALALGPGDTVEILITELSSQPEPPSGPSDKMIYTGGRITTVDVTGCGFGDRPVQNAVLIDPAGGRSGRIVGLITASEVDPVGPGTQLRDLTPAGTCAIGATVYNRYQATVE